MTTKTNQLTGFTLIELLVVITVIGILATVVLGTVRNARTHSRASAITGTMNTVRAKTGEYLDRNGSFTNLCTTSATLSGISEYITQVTAGDMGGTNSNCTSSANEWAWSITLPGGDQFCMDSAGRSIRSTTTTNSSNTCTN